jgi:hypothetical protein
MMNDTIYHSVLNSCVEQFGPAGLFVGLSIFFLFGILIAGAITLCIKKTIG